MAQTRDVPETTCIPQREEGEQSKRPFGTNCRPSASDSSPAFRTEYLFHNVKDKIKHQDTRLFKWRHMCQFCWLLNPFLLNIKRPRGVVLPRLTTRGREGREGTAEGWGGGKEDRSWCSSPAASHGLGVSAIRLRSDVFNAVCSDVRFFLLLCANKLLKKSTCTT